ncbi:oleosin 16 kDa-like [Ziziphus jujuba]|uniref:Oleosin n=1 Tax=Ziziphus jujuba TaxID=326968 RepID=A0A6P4AXF5_ZIZJJ|nr:oleosin 16 kDa-like [Ziziphus jujuba]
MAQNDRQYQHQSTLTYQFARASTAAAFGGSLELLSGLTLTGTVIALVLATPLLVLFSPVLVPAAITLFLLFAGFVTSSGLGAAGAFVLYWMYNYAAGKHPLGADKLDQLGNMIANIVSNGREHHDQGEEDWEVPRKRRVLL